MVSAKLVGQMKKGNEMLFITPTFHETNLSLWETLTNIDKKLAQISSNLLNNIRYGFQGNISYDTFEDLIIYRDIVNEVMYSNKVYCDVNVKKLVSKINKLTNTIC